MGLCKHDRRDLVGETGFIEWCPACGTLFVFESGRWVSRAPTQEPLKAAIGGLVTVEEGSSEVEECYYEAQVLGRPFWSGAGSRSKVSHEAVSRMIELRLAIRERLLGSESK